MSDTLVFVQHLCLVEPTVKKHRKILVSIQSCIDRAVPQVLNSCMRDLAAQIAQGKFEHLRIQTTVFDVGFLAWRLAKSSLFAFCPAQTP